MIGVRLLAGKFELVLASHAPKSTFDNLPDAILTLFQLLVGEVCGASPISLSFSVSFTFTLIQGWHDVMYTSIKVSSWNTSWFFISYIILVNLLFTYVLIYIIFQAFFISDYTISRNLCIGVILSLFSKVVDSENLSSDAIESAMSGE